MKEILTYRHAQFASKLGRRMFILFSIIVLLAASIAPAASVTVDAASTLKIRYHQKNRNYTGTQLAVTVDGSSVNLKSTPGLALKNAKGETIYMVSAYDVFAKGCGMSYSFKNGKIVLKKYGITVRMYLNSKNAYVNGKKVRLDYPPTLIKFSSLNKTKLYVPSKFVATTFGYTYSYTRNSSTKVTVKMTSAYYLKYDGKWTKYSRTKAKLTFDGTGINVSDLYCVVIKDRFYVQAKAFAKSAIGGKYSYQSSSKKVTITYGEKTLVMNIGSKTAYLNGKKVTMGEPAKLVYNSKNETTFVMVPIAFAAAKLGLNYSYLSSSKTCAITRKDGSYFNWTAQNADSSSNETVTEDGEEGVVEVPEVLSTDYEVTGAMGERISNTDVITMEGYFPTDNISISDSGNTITVSILDSANKVGKESITISQPYLLKSATLSHNTSGDTILKIVKKSAGVQYTFSQEDGFVSVTLTTGAVKNGYVIAVDTGHGANTAGKRTPPLLASLDFDLDGVIDAKKGSQIREHTANVGVGNYAVAALERCGFEVYKSGFGSSDTPLSTRQSNIKSAGADYSISIHFNATGSGTSFNSANGIEVFSHSNSSNAKSSYSLAKAILNRTSKGTAQKNRGVNRSHTFAMTNAKAMGTKGSILLECAFMTNWTEVKTMMASTAYWEETGEEIAMGFCDYLGVQYVAPN